MIATYEVTVKLTVVHEVDKIDENLKGDFEYAESICQFVCDEVTTAGGVASYDIVNSSFNVQ